MRYGILGNTGRKTHNGLIFSDGNGNIKLTLSNKKGSTNQQGRHKKLFFDIIRVINKEYKIEDLNTVTKSQYVITPNHKIYQRNEFKEGQIMKEIIDRKYIEKEVKKLDPKLRKQDEAFKISTILLSGLKVGANVKKIADFLKIDITDVKKYEKNLRSNKIWVKDKTNCNWFDKKDGSISFWLDVSCAQGYIKKV